MNNLVTVQYRFAVVLLLLCSLSMNAQNSYKESFNVGEDVQVSVNTTHTNVVFETWNKNKVEVEVFIDDDHLSAKEKKEIFDNWNFEVLGNSKKVIITSNEGSLWSGIESFGSLKALERLNLGNLKSLESLKGLEALNALKNMPLLEGLGAMNWDFVVPEVPELGKFPIWPFNNQRPNFKNGDDYSYFSDKNKKAYTFDRGAYERNKQAYVSKLNKKYNANVSVRKVDNWLEDVDSWSENIEEVMEKWGENFGEHFEQKFGPKFEEKMEKWGEEFGESMEQWGEEFGEKFGKEMEQWGEEFGKDMEKWAEQFGKDAEKWAEQFEGNGQNYYKKVSTDKNGNKSIIIETDGHGLFDKAKSKAKKTIIIRMPKGTKTDINVRHGEVKMADAVNIKAVLNYSTLTANSIDGGNTLINASYAPVLVNNWKNGELLLQYVDDCRLNNVQKISLESNSSNVNINSLSNEAFLSGSFGSLYINKITDSFKNLDIVLENTDATLSMPNTAFTFYYNGKKSRFKSPAAIEITSKNVNSSHSLLRGFHKAKNSNKSVTINASYSNVSFND